MTLEITDKALDEIAINGYDEAYGARPMKRYIQRAIESPLAKIIISDPDKKHFKIDYRDDRYIFE